MNTYTPEVGQRVIDSETLRMYGRAGCTVGTVVRHIPQCVTSSGVVGVVVQWDEGLEESVWSDELLTVGAK